MRWFTRHTETHTNLWYTTAPTAPPPPAPSTSSSRPSSRADRKLRFADLTPSSIHVYESAPSSPRKTALALPPPDPSDPSTISLGQFSGQAATNARKQDLNPQPKAGMSTSLQPETEQDTPEFIRHHYFPNAPENDPNLEWMKSPSRSEASDVSLRFDLTGTPIPPSLASTLPTHLGLHHHADGVQAGYTLEDIFLLSRSTVPSQRATMLGVLARIMRRLGKSRQTGDTAMSELDGQEEVLRKRVLAAGLEAMGERGSVGARAVKLLFECTVCWDEDLSDIEGVELRDGETQDKAIADADVISSLPLDFILPQISASFALPTLPNESLLQLLAVLRRIAQHSDSNASAIVSTPNLVPNVVKTLLLTPIPSSPTSLPPNSAVLRFLTTLAQSSRTNASTLEEPADALLRFLTMLPPASPYPTPLANVLLSATLRFYTSLASYGLYAHIAATAVAPLGQLRSYLSTLKAGPESNELLAAWAGLVEAWTVCATDPHRTTPSHDILWSQVVGSAWNEDVLAFRDTLSLERRDWEVWEMVWRAEAAWLEGARVNGVKGGEEEREAAVKALRDGFEHGKEKGVIAGVIDGLEHELQGSQADDNIIDRLRNLAPCANTLAAAIRIWLACISPQSEKPLLLPFAQISDICAKLATHPLWYTIYSKVSNPRIRIVLRPLTTLLSVYLRLSKRLPDVSSEMWMAQALVILIRFFPGDEDAAQQFLDDLTSEINPLAMTARGWHTPEIIWQKGGLEIIKPFLMHNVRPTEAAYIGPRWMSPRSILLSTTQRLPTCPSRDHGVDTERGLPLANDWPLSPINHLLRSGSSSVFKSMPSSWDASETEVVRASLLLTKVCQVALRRYSMNQFTLTREEIVFGCMKTFMLEHGHPGNYSSQASDEVFRDRVVEQLMCDLLTPFMVAAAPRPTPPGVSPNTREDLEKVAMTFLGSTTPFYQYYTDFVALYDAISFAHPLFARLLLPPTALRYPTDYRKYLWTDFRHVLRTVRVPFDQVIAGDIGEYLWPVEDDPHMIRAYLGALLKEPLWDVVRLIAVHHIACNIWPDLRQDDGNGDERGGTLLKTIVEQGGMEVVKDVVTYRQSRHGPALLPPKCFEDEGPWKETRTMCIESWGGPVLVERLGNLLQSST